MNSFKTAVAVLVVSIGLGASCNPEEGGNTGGGTATTGGGSSSTGGGSAATGGGSGATGGGSGATGGGSAATGGGAASTGGGSGSTGGGTAATGGGTATTGGGSGATGGGSGATGGGTATTGGGTGATGGGTATTGGGTGATGGGTGATGGGTGSSCVLDGVWNASKAAGPNNTINIVVTTPSTFTFERTGTAPTAHVDGTYTFNTSNSQLVLTNNSVTTTDSSFDACIGVPGTYTLSFTDCTHFTLALVMDNCATRSASVGGGTTVFTKQ